MNVFKTLAITIITVILITSKAYSQPSISGVSGTLVHDGTVTVTGNGFGTKDTAAPKFFNNMENVTIGQHPAGFTIYGGNPVGTPVALSPSRGSSTKAMKFSADLTAVNPSDYLSSWNESIYDLGNSADRIFVSYWIYLDNAGTVCTASPANDCIWQWKNTYIGSHPSAYTQNDTFTTTMGINNWIRYKNSFFNTFETSYYNGLTFGGSNPGAPSDFYQFGQWQRVSIYIQRSSAPLTADGKFQIKRIDRVSMLLNDNTVITHDSDDSAWRYIAFGQAITNVCQDYVGLGGRVVWNSYYDDVYIDNTQARIEVCNASTWSSVTQCEIQIPSAWSPNSVTITANQGSFANSQNAYIYVVDSDGNVNANGYPITIGAAADSTAPITTASPAGGVYSSTKTVALSVNESAVTYYTTNNSTPTTASQTYSSPISISTTTTLKYFSKDTAGNEEAVKTETYVINLPDTNAPARPKGLRRKRQ